MTHKASIMSHLGGRDHGDAQGCYVIFGVNCEASERTTIQRFAETTLGKVNDSIQMLERTCDFAAPEYALGR